MSKQKLKIPDFGVPLLNGTFRYNVLKGGRGSGKSYTVADVLLMRGMRSPRRILCAREFQNSIAESVHQLLKERIYDHGWESFWNITNSSIVGINGTEFFFKGVRHNINSVKSMQGIDDCWLEEAQTVSKVSWDTIIPTIRKPGSRIFVTYNPDGEDDPTHVMFGGAQEFPPNSYVEEVNWDRNPWFPDILKEEKDYLYKVNPELAAHVWGGECRSHSDAQIFKGKYSVKPFEIEPHFKGPYYGADWGFSIDPSTLVEIYIDLKNKKLLFRRACGGVGIELDDIPKKLYEKIPGSKRGIIRADSSRPETISHLCKKGYRVTAAEKWEGSVEDGIEWMKNFVEIVIHPECQKECAQEFKNYSYKVDKLTQDVTTDIVDAYNHYIDAARYACQPMIKKGGSILDFF